MKSFYFVAPRIDFQQLRKFCGELTPTITTSESITLIETAIMQFVNNSNKHLYSHKQTENWNYNLFE